MCGCPRLFRPSDIRHIARCRLYGIYMGVVIFLFYIVLFRHTIRRATGEVEKARNFVLRMPLYILDQDRLEIFLTFFQSGDDDNDDDDDEAVSPKGAGIRAGDSFSASVDKALPRMGSDDSFGTAEFPQVCLCPRPRLCHDAVNFPGLPPPLCSALRPDDLITLLLVQVLSHGASSGWICDWIHQRTEAPILEIIQEEEVFPHVARVATFKAFHFLERHFVRVSC